MNTYIFSNTFRRTIGGPRIFALVGVLSIAMASLATAADTPQAAIAYRPGDTIRVFVTFAEPIALKNGMVRFNLQGPLPDGQKVLNGLFDANSLVRLSEREYEVQAKISDNVATGTYQVSAIAAVNESDLSRWYTSQADFPTITICIRNDRRVEFPNVKSIRVADPSEHKP